MTDVIDALKRLERVGSENSKTTEKLIQAAAALAATIAGMYNPGADELIQVISDWSYDAQGLPIQGSHSMNYMISGGILVNGHDYTYVAQNRDAALAFSSDVANGLLDLITENLQTRKEQSQGGLSILENALKDLGK